MSYTIRKVLNPSDEEIEEMVSVLAAAFAAGKEMEAALGKELADKVNVPINHAQITSGASTGTIYVSEEINSGKILGVCVCFGPGRIMGDTPEQRAAALDWLSLIPVERRKRAVELLGKLDALRDSALGMNVARDEWYLQRIGVLPSHQRKGIAGALIREVMKNSEGLRVALSTIMPANAKYYQSLGFEVKGRAAYDATSGQVEGFSMLWAPGERKVE